MSSFSVCLSRTSPPFLGVLLLVLLLLCATQTCTGVVVGKGDWAWSSLLHDESRQASSSESEDEFSPSSVFPSSRTVPIPVHQSLSDQLMSWDDTSIFFAVSSILPVVHPSFSDKFHQVSLVFVPTNIAFAHFLSAVYPQLSLLDTLPDTSVLPHTFKLVTTLLQDPLLLPTFVNALSSLIDYHLVHSLQDSTEPNLPSSVSTFLHNRSLDLSQYPDIIDSQTNVVHRLGKQFIHVHNNQTLVIIDQVLLPLPIPLIASMFPKLPNTLAVDDHDIVERPSTTQSPYFFRPFSSKLALVEGRNDLNIIQALLQVDYQSIRTLFAVMGTDLHILLPTDLAFIQLIASIIDREATALDNLLKSASTMGAVSLDPQAVMRIFDRVSKVLASVPSLPTISQILQYHVLLGGASLSHRVGRGPQDTAFVDKQNIPFQLVIKQTSHMIFIQDLDPSRVDAKVIASFPTIEGYVSVIDSLLTTFDVAVATTVIGAAAGDGHGDGHEDEDEDEGVQDSTPEPGNMSNSSISTKGAACFPGSAAVHTSRGIVKMRDLQAGDEVWTYPMSSSDNGVVEKKIETSRIFLFTHRDASRSFQFVTIHTRHQHSLTISSDHYVYTAAGRLITAGALKKGMFVVSVDGIDEVIHVGRVYLKEHGLYAPHSLHGDLVVDGVWTSGYSKAIAPMWAHALLAPVRFVAEALDVREPLGHVLDRGWDSVVGKVLPLGRDQY